MILPPEHELDPREADELAKVLRTRRPAYVREWTPSEQGPDAALMPLVARFVHTILQRLNQAPTKSKLAFLDMLGIQLISPQAARAPIVFQIPEKAPSTRLLAGTRVAAPPPPDSTNQVVFETERTVGLSAARLVEVRSLWPGRDQLIDHSEAHAAGESYTLFERKRLEDTPHAIYIAHDTLLNLSGSSALDVAFDLLTGSEEHLSVVWEYWDGSVWREFKDMRPGCDEEEAARLDSTDGLQHDGIYRLETDCAETAKTTVDGHEAFWIRGRLDETLPPDPAKELPEIDGINLSAVVTAPLSFAAAPVARRPRDPQHDLRVFLHDNANAPLSGIWVCVTVAADNSICGWRTDDDGKVTFSKDDLQLVAGMNLLSIHVSFGSTARDTAFSQMIRVPLPDDGDSHDVHLTLGGVKPDAAFANQEPLDLTKTFQPFGPQPQPGAAFYFSSEQVFSKPGASLLFLVRNVDNSRTNDLAHVVAWEYWNGRQWRTLAQSESDAFVKRSLDLNSIGVVRGFIVPPDMVATDVNGQTARWMRVRLVSGRFGIHRPVADGSPIPIPSGPTLADFRIGYTWQYGPYRPAKVVTYNDFRYADHTDDAMWPGRTFRGFEPVEDTTPTLYLGYDKPPSADRLGTYIDLVEERGEVRGPELIWEYWNGTVWEALAADDETRHLRVPGIVSYIGPSDSDALARFGAQRHWVRARLKEDGEPGEPTVRGIYPNAVWAEQYRTVTDEAIGSSTGRADQVLRFRESSVLPGQHVEVREVSGRRANVEWRIIAKELLGGDADGIRTIEAQLAAEGNQRQVQVGDLRLSRDAQKRVTAVWVRWHEQRHLQFSGPRDRHYVVESARGRLIFGDGETGRIPPAGAAVLARRYRTGGGQTGNVKARTITQTLGAVGAVEAVFNPRAAEGGADGETLASVLDRGPRTVRHRGRALLPADFETMAREASASVAFARAVPGLDAAGQSAPGWLTLLIIPHSDERRPWPSFGLRDRVRRYVSERAAADVVAARRIHVTGPEYLPVDVDATIAPLDPSEAGVVETRARAALERFLHPIRGGPTAAGWPLGRDVYLSDVANVLEAVSGVDYVTGLALRRNGVPQGECLTVPHDQTVVAGQLQLKLVVGEA